MWGCILLVDRLRRLGQLLVGGWFASTHLPWLLPVETRCATAAMSYGAAGMQCGLLRWTEARKGKPGGRRPFPCITWASEAVDQPSRRDRLNDEAITCWNGSRHTDDSRATAFVPCVCVLPACTPSTAHPLHNDGRPPQGLHTRARMWRQVARAVPGGAAVAAQRAAVGRRGLASAAAKLVDLDEEFPGWVRAWLVGLGLGISWGEGGCLGAGVGVAFCAVCLDGWGGLDGSIASGDPQLPCRHPCAAASSPLTQLTRA